LRIVVKVAHCALKNINGHAFRDVLLDKLTDAVPVADLFSFND
jgi:hypothetical protein